MNTLNTKSRTITIKKADVYFDVDKLSLDYSDIAAADAPVKADRIATETQAAGGERIIRRMCDHRMSDIRQLLQKFITPTNVTTADDTLDTGNWVIGITITTEAEDNTLASIADLIHDYIVTGALADWYAQLGVQGNRESLNLRAEAAKKEIRELIYFRPMP